jgi:hypothetical protein
MLLVLYAAAESGRLRRRLRRARKLAAAAVEQAPLVAAEPFTAPVAAEIGAESGAEAAPEPAAPQPVRSVEALFAEAFAIDPLPGEHKAEDDKS